MSRLSIPDPIDAPAASQPFLASIEKQLGKVPNGLKVLSKSPAILEGFLALNRSLGKALEVKTRERIAIAVSEINGCPYCLASHTYFGLEFAKLSPKDAAEARHGNASDPQSEASLRFAMAVAKQRGKVSDEELAAVKAAGFSEAQIVEIVALVAGTFFTNLVNLVVQTDLDYPAVTD